MKAYLTYQSEKTVEFEMPSRRPIPGDILIVQCLFYTAGGAIYEKGDILKIVDWTTKEPHCYGSSLGNFVVQTKLGTSVWSSIDYMLYRRIVKFQE